MSPRRFLPFVALALFLTACTAATTSPSPSASPSPSEASSPSKLEHLEFYDQFDWYNNSIDEHDFVISETEVDGQLQYQFQNEEHGVTIFVSPRGKTETSAATLAYQEKTLRFEVPIFILGYGNVSGVAGFYLEDLTGDDTPELVYIYGAGGTGVWQDNAKVFDLSNMTEYPVRWDNEALAELVKIAPLELRKGKQGAHAIVCSITGPDGQSVYGTDLTKETLLPGHAKAWFGGHEGIWLDEDGTLTLTSLFCSDHSLFTHYIGSVSAPFAFDPDAASFTLDTSRVTLTTFDDNT